jgi:cytidine deaminase
VSAIGISASPCGGCRQWLHEWRIPDVTFRRNDGSIGSASPAELLPESWDFPE